MKTFKVNFILKFNFVNARLREILLSVLTYILCLPLISFSIVGITACYTLFFL